MVFFYIFFVECSGLSNFATLNWLRLFINEKIHLHIGRVDVVVFAGVCRAG